MPDINRPYEVRLLAPGQLERARRELRASLALARIGELSDQWSFLWDKRRSLWIAAEDCPDGEQVEGPDLDVLLARLPGFLAARV